MDIPYKLYSNHDREGIILIGKLGLEAQFDLGDGRGSLLSMKGGQSLCKNYNCK